MVTDLPCAKCGSTKIVPRARVIDRGHAGLDYGNVQVGAARRPHKLFKLQEKADVHARVCGACGFTELFVDDPASIYEAYVQSEGENG